MQRPGGGLCPSEAACLMVGVWGRPHVPCPSCTSQPRILHGSEQALHVTSKLLKPVLLKEKASLDSEMWTVAYHTVANCPCRDSVPTASECPDVLIPAICTIIEHFTVHFFKNMLVMNSC